MTTCKGWTQDDSELFLSTIHSEKPCRLLDSNPRPFDLLRLVSAASPFCDPHGPWLSMETSYLASNCRLLGILSRKYPWLWLRLACSECIGHVISCNCQNYRRFNKFLSSGIHQRLLPMLQYLAFVMPCNCKASPFCVTLDLEWTSKA